MKDLTKVEVSDKLCEIVIAASTKAYLANGLAKETPRGVFSDGNNPIRSNADILKGGKAICHSIRYLVINSRAVA